MKFIFTKGSNTMKAKSLRQSALPFLLIFVAAFSIRAGAQTLQSDEVSIKPGETREWKFAAPQTGADKIAAISLDARLDSPPGGSMYFMDIRVNGAPVNAAIDRLRSRLKNKPLLVAPDKPRLMWDSPGAGWRVLYAPAFDAQYQDIYGPEAYRFVLAIGDLLKPGENTISIRRVPAMHDKPLVIRNLQLTDVPSEDGSTPSLPRAGSAPEINYGTGLFIKAGNLRLPISTSFSVPGGGWKRMGEAIAPREGETAAEVRGVGGGQTWQESFKEKAFEVARLITSNKDQISIRDTITNLTDQDLGMMVRREIKLPAPVPTVYLGGDDNSSSNTSTSAENPTIFVPFADFSVGIVDNDDAIRAQGIRTYDASVPAVSTRTERLAIPARGKITLDWSVYVSPSTDYFDFLNRVRSDWGVNDTTIRGPWWWGFDPAKVAAMKDEDLRDWAKRTNAYALVSSGGWVDRTKTEDKPPLQIGFGTGVMEPAFANHRADFKAAAEKVHRVIPGVKFALYEHMFLNEPESNPEEFRDSWITREDGTRHSIAWAGRYTVSRGVYPTLENSFGKAFRAALETQKRELGADGFYIDETNLPSGLSADPITYNAWDGCSAILDPKTFAIKHKIGYTFLLSEKYQNQLIKEMSAEGTWFLGNGAPSTRSQNNSKWPRFVEAQVVVSNARLAQLYTPLAFGSGAPSVEILRRELAYGVLHSCNGPSDKTGIVGKFFPITPTELHNGWVQGKERVVTSVSGKFGWANEKFGYRIWSYRADGAPVEAAPQWKTATGLVQVEVPENGIAILERQTP
jgi:hypothetical protein